MTTPEGFKIINEPSEPVYIGQCDRCDCKFECGPRNMNRDWNAICPKCDHLVQMQRRQTS